MLSLNCALRWITTYNCAWFLTPSSVQYVIKHFNFHQSERRKIFYHNLNKIWIDLCIFHMFKKNLYILVFVYALCFSFGLLIFFLFICSSFYILSTLAFYCDRIWKYFPLIIIWFLVLFLYVVYFFHRKIF